jgi:3-methyladenine DNA glycosylase AlkD
VHEERLIALVIMDHQFKIKSNSEIIYKLYLNNLKGINNWDLVDLSAPNIVGNYLLLKCQQFDAITSKEDPRNILYEWAVSNSLWERRISILSTFSLIRANYFYDTLKISKILLNDKHDLIHKAVGWMLREVGKRNEVIQEKFIRDNYSVIPRTALRYAI